MCIWRDENGKLCVGGYRPDGDKLDVIDPPQGGSGMPIKGATTARRSPTTVVVKSPFADHIPGLENKGDQYDAVWEWEDLLNPYLILKDKESG